jgi:ferredoxin
VRVKVDEDRCIGSGQCVLAAPEIFDQDPVDGMVTLLDDEPASALREHVTGAIQFCPVGAIAWDSATAGT